MLTDRYSDKLSTARRGAAVLVAKGSLLGRGVYELRDAVAVHGHPAAARHAGSNTTVNHLDVLAHAIAQVPAGHRGRLLVRRHGRSRLWVTIGPRPRNLGRHPDG